jgi:hypothetical protein
MLLDVIQLAACKTALLISLIQRVYQNPYQFSEPPPSLPSFVV